MSIPIPRPPHHNIWYYLFEGAYLGLQGGSAKLQAIQIAKNVPIFHFWWTAGMVLVAGIMVVSYKKLTRCQWKEALRLGISLLLVRFISFTPWLNKLRHKPTFYLGSASLEDRLLKGWYPWAWAAAILAWIFM